MTSISPIFDQCLGITDSEKALSMPLYDERGYRQRHPHGHPYDHFLSSMPLVFPGHEPQNARINTSYVFCSSRSDTLPYHHPHTSFSVRPRSAQQPHSCSFCSRSFARRHDLDRHTRVHTGLKPYLCPCCFRAFARSDARGRHFRSEEACQQGDPALGTLGRKDATSTCR